MDNSQPDPTLPPPSLSGEAPSEVQADPAAELAGMRGRLAFYETFDSLILENVQRSGELLRQVAAEREGVDQRLDAMRYELEARLLQQRTVLEEVAANLSDLEQSLGSVSSRVNEAVAGLTSPSLGVPSAVPPSNRQMPVRDEAADAAPDLAGTGRAEESGGSPTVLEEPGPTHLPPDLATGTIAEMPALDELPSEDEPTPPWSEDEPTRPTSVPSNFEPMPVSFEKQPTPLRSEDEHAPLQPPAAEPDRLIVEPPPAEHLPRRVDLVVHGVPKAAAALSLQRHLQDLAGVAAVEVREYVSGVLRFQVMATSFAAADVLGWEGGALETVTERADVVELRLQGADGV